ncbi:MAG: PqqD family protein [Xanthomonadales bacterium]|nr:PqqD family protein [Xanthomonadales bacterium]
MAQKILLSKDALFQEVSGETVILDLASESYFGLNEVGSRIWSLLESGKSQEEAHEILLQEFDVGPQKLQDDMNSLIGELSAAGLVEITNQ